MSGYRTLHRINEGDFPLYHQDPPPNDDPPPSPTPPPTSTTPPPPPPTQPVWSVSFSPCTQTKPHRNDTSSPPLRLLTSSADGYLRAYRLTDKPTTQTPTTDEGPDATALRMELTHVLLPSSTADFPPMTREEVDEESGVALGSAALSVLRNYTGGDSDAGQEIVCSLRLDGYATVYTRDEQPLYHLKLNDPNEDDSGKDRAMPVPVPVPVRPTTEFHVPDAAGTTLELIPPTNPNGNNSHHRVGDGTICVLIGRLDGSVAVLSTGIVAHYPSANTNHNNNNNNNNDNDNRRGNEPTDAGTVLETVGAGSAVPTGIAIHPLSSRELSFAVGRKDGTIDLYSRHNHLIRRCHRITIHAGSTVRAVAYTPDGNLLLTGSDDGTICVHDASSLCTNGTIRLVTVLGKAHRSYVLSIASLPGIDADAHTVRATSGDGDNSTTANNNQGDSTRFVSCSADGTVKVWDVVDSKEGGSPVHIFDAGGGSGSGRTTVWDVGCSWGRREGGDRRCVSCGEDGSVWVHSL